ncbi:hypothetical protein FACS1894174_03170 [Bacteroidia bacterium]|nr:hypothetical protein FACS1894174_03170 [Bacteroidia bacterium]
MNRQKAIVTILLLFSVIALSAQDAKYEMKSAIIRKEVLMMGIKIEGMQYFDDFGRKEAVDITIKNGVSEGVDKVVRTVATGDKVVTADLNSKTVTQMTLPVEPINYLQLTPEVKEKYNLKELGEEMVLGKNCRKFSVEITQMGQLVYTKAWVWKGIVLKSEIESNGMTISIDTVIEIQENVPIPADKLTIPAGVVIQ